MYSTVHAERGMDPENEAPPRRDRGGAFILEACGRYFPPESTLWIDSAARLPAPAARMTVAAPVTASPPA